MVTLFAIVLAVFVLPSPWGAIAVIAGALIDVVETAIVYRWAKRRRPAVGVEALVGRRAVALDRLAPTGQVRIDGEVWQARSSRPVERGTEIVVTGVRDLVLEVSPADEAEP